ncbi:hypothetical protein AB0J72_05640 [Dactylosporangium sp. NPDC049742]|uniref:hypothetical protein n=1 Tax=Dactylosporangium sp. NPDC049742 TaxID=3154737 RepID=UPI00344629C6
MTSLTAPAVGRPRRAGTAVLVAAVTLVPAWLTAGLLWSGGWSESAREDALVVPPLLFATVTFAYLTSCHRRRGPVAFEVRDGAFIAPPADRLSAAAAVAALAGSTVGAGTLLVDGPETMPGSAVAGWCTVIALMVAAFLRRLHMRARSAGRILLRPEGLLITYAYGTREVPWDAVSAGPPRTGLMAPKLRIGRPDLVRATGLARRGAVKASLPTAEAWVLREFLADTINHYLTDPAARQHIGTAEEHEHLRRVLCG